MYSTFESDKKLVKYHPSARQLEVEKMEFYAFAHFTVNTFTDLEWGNGTEPEEIFNPTEFDANQWVNALKSAGIKGLILTCKHHDGFCLWPSAYTEHSVKNSPFKHGKGDVVREVSEACARGNIKFGVYLSPWDRNCPLYGQGKAYDDYFCSQLTELLTQYGELFSVWFDGACGEGPNGKRQIYDWERYYALIRKLQPNACISISGPDIRWCGNESGQTRESEWSVLPTEFYTPEEVAANSQKSDDTSFREKKVDCMARDLGSREFLEGAKDYRWYPSETDVSIRPGWFYHASEDDRVRSAENLIDIWYRTVGGNSMLLLNIPPDRRGLFHETDVQRLREMGEYIDRTFAVNLAENATVTSDKDDGYHTADALKTDSYDEYFKTFDGENTAEILIELAKKSDVTHIVMKEHIPMGQRIEKYTVYAELENGVWKTVESGTTVGYKRIMKFDSVHTDKIRISITDSRICPILSFVGVY
ncbi:MAG: alpha-fucosidase [Ruminococcaceae bacterium]|nr:alpha-fucosidase [Oscillospiraceae bacterium]